MGANVPHFVRLLWGLVGGCGGRLVKLGFGKFINSFFSGKGQMSDIYAPYSVGAGRGRAEGSSLGAAGLSVGISVSWARVRKSSPVTVGAGWRVVHRRMAEGSWWEGR